MKKFSMPLTAGPTTPNITQADIAKRKQVPKYIICAKCFLDHTSGGLNELDALREYGDTCLHSTVSYLANNHGIAFNRKWEPHEHQHGGQTQFKRYWLSIPSQATKLVSLYYPEEELCL